VRQWFFDVFVPDIVEVPGRNGAMTRVAWEEVPTDLLASDPSLWELRPGADWHGFKHVAPGWAMTDPNKLIVLTPGFDTQGRYSEQGVPAPVVAEYLRQNRIVCEKNDLNSLLFLLTPGVESSKAGTLLSHLVTFKKLYDDNALLDDVIPDFVARRPQRYAGLRLRDLCDEMHALYRDANVSALQGAQFRAEHLPEMVILPSVAVKELVRNNVDYLPLDEVEGRIATTLWVVYPPGIATIVPGERLTERSRPMVDYLRTFERAANHFPGFETEVQGLHREVQPDGTVRFYTYVVKA
jgi:arginine/lysine/ornithine decarboxylase